MDFITQLPPSHGKTPIWIIVDRHFKSAHFIALSPNYTSITLPTTFLTTIYRLHGLPKSIVSDRDPPFLSRFRKELFSQLGTTLLNSSAYHPQTDGQTEIVNRCIESYLRCFASDECKTWYRYLYLAEFWYNTNFSLRHRHGTIPSVIWTPSTHNPFLSCRYFHGDLMKL